ncbi:MAG TPA: hypothetical protein VKU41_23780 [Polyangiaceae bacterium]|nr:hypothetical protein [Polyangiaceae bacterium]
MGSAEYVAHVEALASPPQEALGSGETAAGDGVLRPEPGLARGRWEAPAWAFYATLVVAILAAAVWVAALRRRTVPR